jgi:NAD+ synthetase
MTYSLTDQQAQEVIKKIRHCIQEYFCEYNLTYAIFGKSEGLDSSVIAGLLSDLEGVRPIGVLMPCESKPEVERIARLVLDHFNIPAIKVDLTGEYHTLLARLYSSGSAQDQLAQIAEDYGDKRLLQQIILRKSRAAGNIKVRLRMITLYHIAQLTGGLVVSTDNLSELWMGFWTINGDVGDYAPIQNVWKGLEEYQIARVLGVPEESIGAVPTDGLDITPNGTDEDQLGLPYYDLDRVIVQLLKNKFDGSTKSTLEEMSILSEKIAGELNLPPQRVLHIACQLSGTNFKRNWPKVITREEAGLGDNEDLDVN